MTEQEFVDYLASLKTWEDVNEVYSAEKSAGRDRYALLAQAELTRRGLPNLTMENTK